MREQAPLHVTGPIHCNQARADLKFCVSCDISESEVEQWLADNPGCAQNADGGCCIEQLTGEPVRFTNGNVTATWNLFEEDPLLAALHPTKGNNNRRFFCYGTTSKLLGGTMTRVKLPECVELHKRVPRLPECVEAVEGVQGFQPQKIRRSKSNGRPRSGVRSKKSLPPPV